MKTYCKNVDPSDLNLIRKYVWQTLTKGKLKKYNYASFVMSYSDDKKLHDIWKIAGTNDFSKLDIEVERISLDIQSRIRNRDLRLDPIKFRYQKDGLSGKVREIGLESAMQQCMEHLAVGCLEELWQKRVCYHQYASIKGKGQWAGVKQIRRWAKEKKFRYFVKLDIKKCFQSIKRQVIFSFLGKEISKNPDLLWFISALLENHTNGLVIGSPLGQFFCNYLMSFAYRYVKSLHKIRRGKLIKLVTVALFYMDDILLCGSDRRNLKLATKKLVLYFSVKMELTVKPNWHIKDFFLEPIDMMGHRIYRDSKLRLRKRLFIRVRRAYIRFYGGIKESRRVSSYYGYLKHANVRSFELPTGRTVYTNTIKTKSAEIISLDQRRKTKCAA